MLAIAGSALAMEGVPGGHTEPEPTSPDVPPVPDTPTEENIGDQNDVAVEATTEGTVVTEEVEVEVADESVTSTMEAEQATRTAEQATTALVNTFSEGVAADGTWEGPGQTEASDADGSKSALSAVLNMLGLSGTQDGNAATEALVTFFREVAEAATKAADTLAQALQQSAPSSVAPQDLVVQDSSALENVKSNTGAAVEAPAKEEVAANIQNLAQESDNPKTREKLAGKTPMTVIPPVTPTRRGIFNINPPIAKPEAYGKRIDYHPIKTPKANRRGLSARISALLAEGEEPDENATFFNSKGDVVTTVPGNTPAEVAAQVVPGYYTIAAYMDPDYEYTPVVLVPADEVATTKETVTVSKDVVIVADPLGKWTTSVDIDEFRIFATDDDTEALNYKRLTKAVATAWNLSDDFPVINSYLTNPAGSNEYKMRRLPKVISTDTLSDDFWYVVAVTYDIPSPTELGSREIKKVDQPLKFYHNVSVDSTASLEEGTARFFVAGETTGTPIEMVSSDIFDNQGESVEGWVAMKLPKTETPEEYYPYITLQLEAASTPTPGTSEDVNPTPGTSGDVNPTPGTSGDVNPTPTPGGNTSGDVSSRDITIRHGGSSGGCSTGFSIFGLLAISGLALLRKEK